jgi:hypothetical protein
MEVLAPTLSRIPLVVSPPNFIHQKHIKRCNRSTLDDVITKDGRLIGSEERRAVWKATTQFLGRAIDIKNVSHSVVPIRATRSKANSPLPVMKVSIIVGGPFDDFKQDDVELQLSPEHNEDTNYDNESNIVRESYAIDGSCTPSASMQLVRMINNIPMLDSSEALACGLVQGVVSSKRMWNAYGLEVNSVPTKGKESTTPTFSVRDSDQLLPFFSTRSHALLATGYPGKEDDQTEKTSNSRLDNTIHLPAAQRLGDIVIIAQIQAEPSILPLPTLSKVNKMS